jgi:hypothetical protein
MLTVGEGEAAPEFHSFQTVMFVNYMRGGHANARPPPFVIDLQIGTPSVLKYKIN